MCEEMKMFRREENHLQGLLVFNDVNVCVEQ